MGRLHNRTNIHGQAPAGPSASPSTQVARAPAEGGDKPRPYQTLLRYPPLHARVEISQ